MNADRVDTDSGGAAHAPGSPGKRRPLRVLHIGPTPFFSDRGCHIRIRGLVEALQHTGTECWLCTYHHGREIPEVETERIVAIPGYTRVDAGPSPFKYVADIFLFLKVCGSILRRRPDVLHGHLHEGALIGFAAKAVFFWRRIPLVFDMQGSLTGELEEYEYFGRIPLLGRLFALIERIVDRLPDRIACSSRASLETARDRFGVPEARLALVADGVDVPPGGPAADRDTGESSTERAVDRAARRRALDLPEDTPVIAYSGSLLPVKGLGSLQEAVAEAAERDLAAHFLVIGYPEGPFREFVRSRDLEDRCTITGRLPFERIGEVLALADIALEPKETGAGEASGKLLNYMAAGLPVVCFDTPNNRSILADTGCYASANHAASLVDRIAEMVSDPERARRVGERGRVRARGRFSWDESAAILRRLYDECTGDRPTPADPEYQ